MDLTGPHADSLAPPPPASSRGEGTQGASPLAHTGRGFEGAGNPADLPQACAIGLDVGGTKIAAGAVAFPSGQVLVRRTIPTRANREGRVVLSDALALAEDIMAQGASAGLEMRGIGVGVAELVDLDGRVTSAQTIAWQGLPVQEEFARLAPAVVEADVRAAALAEALLGAGRPFKTFAYVTVGTGISYSLVQDGRPYAGARGNALIFASAPLSTTCTECGAQLQPVLEEIASGPALVARYNAPRPHGVAQAEDVVAAAAAGDQAAMDVVRTAGEALGISVGFLVNVLDPEAVIVGGGLGLAGGLYWQSFVAATRAHVWSPAARDLPIVPAALGTDAGLIGAAATIWRRHRLEERGDEAPCPKPSQP
jgi:glucokinase